MLAYYIQGDAPDSWELYVVPMATGVPVRIPQTSRLGATWSPDGSKLLIVTARNDTLDIATVTPDGQTIDYLTNTPEIEFRADWAEGGNKVLMSRTDGALQQLLLYSISDGTTIPFSAVMPAVHVISVSPDGYKVLWHDERIFYAQAIEDTTATVLSDYYPMHLFATPVVWSDDNQLAFWLNNAADDNTYVLEEYLEWRISTPTMPRVPANTVWNPVWLPQSHIISMLGVVNNGELLPYLWNVDRQTFTEIPVSFPRRNVSPLEWWIEATL